MRVLPRLLMVVVALGFLSMHAARSAPQQIPDRIRLGGNVPPPRLVKRVEPNYPPLALQARIEGTLSFNVIVARDGSVLDVELLNGHPLLVQAALEGIRQWQFQPTVLNGAPVEVVFPIELTFTLGEPEADRPDGKVRPTPEQRLRFRVTLLQQQNEYHKALADLQAFLERSPESAWARLELANVLSHLNRNLDAIHAIRQGLHLLPDDADLHRHLFDLLIEADMPYEAIGQFRDMRQFLEPDALAFAEVGLLYYRLQNAESAAAEFRLLVQDSADPGEAHAQLARKLLEVGWLEAASLHVGLAAELADEPGEYHGLQQEVASFRRFVERGMALLAERLHMSSATPAVRAALGLGLLTQGRWESEGRAQYRAAVEGGFDESGAHKVLATCLVGRLGARAALAELRALLGRSRAAPYLRLAIADLLTRLGDADNAILEARAAIASSPDDAELCRQLADLLRKSGDMVGAAAETALAEQLPDGPPRPDSLWQLLEQLETTMRAEEQQNDPMAAQDAMALGAVRAILTACVQYSSTYDQGFPLSLASLGPPRGGEGQPASLQYADLIDPELASGSKSGYTFLYVVTGTDSEGRPSSFELYADPVRPGVTGNGFFYADQSGLIRFSTGGRARATDPPIQ